MQPSQTRHLFRMRQIASVAALRQIASVAALRQIASVAALLLLAIITPTHAAVQYTTTSDWGSGFNGQIDITNTTTQALNAWSLAFDFDKSITSIWDATIVSHVGKHYVIKSAGWNDSIAANNKVSFGFGGSPGNMTTGPQNFVVNGTPVVTTPPTPTPIPTPTPDPIPTPAPTGIQATITQTSGWNGGFGANLDISNGGKLPINGWTLVFQFAPSIDSLWNGTVANKSTTYTVTPASWDGVIPAGGKVTLGFTGSGTLTVTSASSATLNGVTCPITVIPSSNNPSPSNPTGTSIVIGAGVDATSEALQITIPQGASTFPLSLNKSGTPAFTVAVNNPSVVTAQIIGGALQLKGLGAGRSGLRLKDSVSGAIRYVGVRVKTSDGKLPGRPNYLAVGSVSEDTDDHLNFWHSFDVGAKNRYVDARYIYLNGGPTYGWATWTGTPGGRAVSYIRESKKMGMLPIFVWYNIADGGESYYTDMQHVQDASYMKQYYQLLQLLMTILKQESPDEPVGMILEPDFIGYLAQNSGMQAAQITAATSAAYDSGLLQRGVDPTFPNTVQGVVQSINYIIHRDAPQVFFGWQMNLWASPAGGWTTPIPGTGIVHLTDTKTVTQGRTFITSEATAITQYYLNAGVTSSGAAFLSIDKYGLDAATAEAAAAQDPANSTWFWNNDQWTNYLTFVQAMHTTSKLPIILWQLPVGHINTTLATDPYTSNSKFPDLTNSDRQGEDSAPTFFFGDTFQTTGKRFTFFSTNKGADAALSTFGSNITWGEHLSSAAAAGVTMALFGAGVGGSTTNVGTPPTDSYWWITKAQYYFAHPIPLSGK